MAEVLIRAVDHPYGDGAGDLRERMAVVVMPDGHPWGDLEDPDRTAVAYPNRLAPHAIIELPRASVEELRTILLEPKRDTTGAVVGPRARRFDAATGGQAIQRGRLRIPDVPNPRALSEILETL